MFFQNFESHFSCLPVPSVAAEGSPRHFAPSRGDLLSLYSRSQHSPLCPRVSETPQPRASVWVCLAPHALGPTASGALPNQAPAPQTRTRHPSLPTPCPAGSWTHRDSGGHLRLPPRCRPSAPCPGQARFREASSCHSASGFIPLPSCVCLLFFHFLPHGTHPSALRLPIWSCHSPFPAFPLVSPLPAFPSPFLRAPSFSPRPPRVHLCPGPSHPGFPSGALLFFSECPACVRVPRSFPGVHEWELAFHALRRLRACSGLYLPSRSEGPWPPAPI